MIQVLVVLQMEILLAARLLPPQLIALTQWSKECRIPWLLDQVLGSKSYNNLWMQKQGTDLGMLKTFPSIPL